MTAKGLPPSRFASPPCLAAEVAPGYFDPLAADPQQALDVARWRKSERVAQLEARAALSVTDRQALASAVDTHLDTLLSRVFPDIGGMVVSGYWPIKSELDLQPWMIRMAAKGVRLALPVVETPKAPLVFRPWSPGAAMERGHWNIPVPARRDTLRSDIALAPLVGWDSEGYRLGYGGGYFDRTLAAERPRPFAIGVGLQAAKLGTIFPQPHDIRLDAIVTEAGLQWCARRGCNGARGNGNGARLEGIRGKTSRRLTPEPLPPDSLSPPNADNLLPNIPVFLYGPAPSET